MRKRSKPYDRMTADELAAATREFDQPFAFERTTPLTPRDRQRLARAAVRARQAKPGRPRIGQGAQRITTTVERSLLRQADRYAKARGLTRAQLIAQGLASVLAGAA